MITSQTMVKALPLVPEIGVVALVPGKWNGPWSTRHHILSHLSYYFPIVWVEPPCGWRERLSRMSNLRSDNFSYATPPPGITVRDAWWLPKLYKPRVIADFLDRLRLMDAVHELRRRGCRQIVLYLWRPEFASALDLKLHDISCYHIDDEYSFSEIEQPIEQREERLIRRANQIFIHSPALIEKKGHLNSHTLFVPNGVDFASYVTPQPEPSDMRAIPHPRIGYTGVIKKQMDLKLLVELATRHCDWSFVFIGPRGNVSGHESLLNELERLPNVYFLGGKPVADLPAYVQQFDVGMLCYVANDYTKYIYPLKMHEYLAAGLPVVGCPIQSLHQFRHVITLASGLDEWSRALAVALDPAAVSAEKVRSRQALARGFDWGKHAAKIAHTLCERLGAGSCASID